jgi:serine/threonine protein kinase
VQLINRLLHPSIVLYMGMCIHDDQYEMVTEFLSNGSLFDYLHKEHQKLS